MQSETVISIREYLSTSYHPDCDYVDGLVLERNAGERDHAELQRALIVYFHHRRREWGVHVYPEQRVQVSPTHFRIPDVCVVAGPEPMEQIFRTPPFLCIEILSTEDRPSNVQARLDDYLAFNVPNIWLLDPHTRKAYRCTRQGMLEMEELRTENPDIRILFTALFEE